MAIPLSSCRYSYKASQELFLNKRHFVRWLSSTAITRQSDTSLKTIRQDIEDQPFRLWMLRLSHENGFLSWSRNAAICAGVDATISMIDKPMNPILTYGFVDLGVIFMTVGSLHHVASSYALRGPMKTSRVGLLWILVYTTSIWFCYCLLIRSKLKEQFNSQQV